MSYVFAWTDQLEESLVSICKLQLGGEVSKELGFRLANIRMEGPPLSFVETPRGSKPVVCCPSEKVGAPQEFFSLPPPPTHHPSGNNNLCALVVLPKPH